MPFHNPFIKDGLIKFPDNGNLVRHVERWAKVRGDKLAYRFIRSFRVNSGFCCSAHSLNMTASTVRGA